MARHSYFYVRSWTEGGYRIFSRAEAVHCDLIVGSKRALLIDTGYGIGNLAATVHSITDKPLIVVNTHGHVDHACGNYQFDQVYIHPSDIELLKAQASAESRRGVLGSMIKPDAHMPEDFDKDAWCESGAGIAVPLHEGDVFDLGGATIEVYELPGHTAGSVGFLWHEQRVLFAGDAINGNLWLFSPEALTLSDYHATLKKAQKLAFDRIMQSHPPMLFDKNVIERYLHAAETLDWNAGTPMEVPFPVPYEVRTCAAAGEPTNAALGPHTAYIVISKDHLR